jgi:hypothetical protein
MTCTSRPDTTPDVDERRGKTRANRCSYVRDTRSSSGRSANEQIGVVGAWDSWLGCLLWHVLRAGGKAAGNHPPAAGFTVFGR